MGQAVSARILDEQDDPRLAAILAFTTNLEHAGDIIAKNVMALAAKRLKRRLAFSGEGSAEIRTVVEKLKNNRRMAAAVFVTDDVRAARRLADEEGVFRDLVTRATDAHFARVRTGRLDSLEIGALQLDILRDLRRINGHLLAAAYPLLEERDELLPSRLRG